MQWAKDLCVGLWNKQYGFEPHLGLLPTLYLAVHVYFWQANAQHFVMKCLAAMLDF